MSIRQEQIKLGNISSGTTAHQETLLEASLTQPQKPTILILRKDSPAIQYIEPVFSADRPGQTPWKPQVALYSLSVWLFGLQLNPPEMRNIRIRVSLHLAQIEQ